MVVVKKCGPLQSLLEQFDSGSLYDSAFTAAIVNFVVTSVSLPGMHVALGCVGFET
jgi:hypothetical protein